MTEFFSADWHLGHENILKFCNRPFSTITEMDDAIIAECNRVASKQDILYMLGDFSWKDPALYVDRINPKIVLILGGHDYKWKNRFGMFHEVYDAKTIEIKYQPIVLSHFCFRRWNKSHFNSWHLFGHTHGNLQPIGKSWDVGVDVNKMQILSINDVREIMRNRPDNEDYIPGKRQIIRHVGRTDNVRLGREPR